MSRADLWKINGTDALSSVHIAGTDHVPVPNISSVYPRHTICRRWTYHPKARSFSSGTSGLFVKNIRTFRPKHPEFSRQMPVIPLAEVED
ncbi:hypothetical protein [Bacteroides uniformis]|uniref:Uncharacterized protein n=1 Tax=Bacteroides uniformis TaxID=820 RepID=A0A6I0LI47_BACUN|nr:hypothetical protein [Bacteroides uniformis]KAB4248808.1 hypothetical protein GAO04_17225 [Bacteroides uniformis]KAB4251030.1 hypothetical protein GAP49_10345 [Bacteroides uniformis]KAB4254940.1 hypothetical protein GAP48_09215 [Bacteroides uniformis]KAB4258771.1 hypothetical protein GAP40_18030 [Bacteroides uniformis]